MILFAFKNEKKLIGYGGFVYISWSNKRAELSFLLDTDITFNKKLYKNYSNIYYRLVKKLAFEKLNSKDYLLRRFLIE